MAEKVETKVDTLKIIKEFWVIVEKRQIEKILESIRGLVKFYGLDESGKELAIITREDLAEKVKEAFPEAKVKTFFLNPLEYDLSDCHVGVIIGVPEIEKEIVLMKAKELYPDAYFSDEEPVYCKKLSGCWYRNPVLQRVYASLVEREIYRVINIVRREVMRDVYIFSTNPNLLKTVSESGVYFINFDYEFWSLSTVLFI